jgi:hypothetical protein
VFDVDSLTLRYSWDESPPFYARYSISDVGTVTWTANGRPIYYERFGSSRWNVVFDDPKRSCIGSRPVLVADDLIVMHCKDLTVMTGNGVSYSLPIDLGTPPTPPAGVCQTSGGGVGGKTAIASDARVVAFAFPFFKEKKRFLAENSLCLQGIRVAVFDLVQKKQISTININPVPKNDFDFALSPDGSQLAILNDQEVSVYSVTKR